MKLLHAQSNLEDVLERENFKALSYEYYDDTEILPQLGITNAAYMRRVVAGCREFVRDFDKKHDNLLLQEAPAWERRSSPTVLPGS